MLNQTAPAWSLDARHLWLPWSIPQGVGDAQAFHDRKAAMKCLFVWFLWHLPNSGIWLGDFRLVINLPGPLFLNLCSAGLDEMFSAIPSSSTCGIPKRLFDYYLCFSASPGICPHQHPPTPTLQLFHTPHPFVIFFSRSLSLKIVFFFFSLSCFFFLSPFSFFIFLVLFSPLTSLPLFFLSSPWFPFSVPSLSCPHPLIPSCLAVSPFASLFSVSLFSLNVVFSPSLSHSFLFLSFIEFSTPYFFLSCTVYRQADPWKITERLLKENSEWVDISFKNEKWTFGIVRSLGTENILFQFLCASLSLQIWLRFKCNRSYVSWVCHILGTLLE